MGSRGFSRDSGDEILSEINVVPLVDISLVLLLIFMVTANYIMTATFAVDMPQAKYAKAAAQSEAVTIAISRDGPVYLENEIVTTGELKRRMQGIYGLNPNISVIIAADRNVNFRNVVRVLDLLSELGITRLNIAAVTE
ncbi:MAG: biopolymer transporter ExbD [Candidatus Omnitrophota bacterium]|nr:biopolymer transporter ExbD [Candidatus Omnitrophota bacterium]